MILNSQPQVSYALMDLMVKINAVNMEIFQVLCSSPFLGQSEFTPPPIENSLVLWYTPNTCARSANSSPSYPHRPYARSQTTATATAPIPGVSSSTTRSTLKSKQPEPRVPPSTSATTPCGTASPSTGCYGATPTPPEFA